MASIAHEVCHPKPQSNQRGIETCSSTNLLRHSLGRLNRTSVGLKLQIGYAIAMGLAGLNRTSVGLKRGKTVKPASASPRASIEPAWD